MTLPVLGLASFALSASLLSPTAFAEKKQLSASEAVDLALKGSHTLGEARANTAASAARTRGATSKFLPSLELKLTGGTTRAYEATEAADTETESTTESVKEEVEYNRYKSALVLKQPLFRGLGSYYDLKLKQAEHTTEEINYRKTEAQVVRSVIELYFGIQLHLEELAAENEVRGQRENYLQDIKLMLEQGRTTKLFFLQADYALKSQTPIIKKIDVELAKKRVQLFRLLGLQIDTELTLNEPLDRGYAAVSAIKHASVEDAFRQALAENRDLLIASNQVSASDYEMGVTQAKHYPQLDFVLSANVDTRHRDELNQQQARSYTAELQLTVPIFSGFESFAVSAERIAKRERATETLATVQDTLLTDIKDYYAQWELNTAVLEAEQANLKLAEESIKNALNLFQAGRATVTDVLDSYSRKLQAKRSIAASKYAQILLAMDIQNLLGGSPLALSNKD